MNAPVLHMQRAMDTVLIHHAHIDGAARSLFERSGNILFTLQAHIGTTPGRQHAHRWAPAWPRLGHDMTVAMAMPEHSGNAP